MQVTTDNGQADIEILPDSGADICAAGPSFVQLLGEHLDNLAHSNVAPKAVNGSVLHPLGKIPGVAFQVNGHMTQQDVHIYDSIGGALISWSAAKALDILPEFYPTPAPQTLPPTDSVNEPSTQINAVGTSASNPVNLPTTDQIMSEFSSVFDGQIRIMPGENFHISLAPDSRPFCVTTPRTIPFAYREKLKDELDLLIDQGIIAPITEPTDWCASIVVAPKKDSNRIRLCACQPIEAQQIRST